MTNIITASAPGKIHFIGEHTAVYGKPAILAAIDKRCTVELSPLPTDEIVISSTNMHKTVRLTYPQVLEIRDEAHVQWEEYQKTGNLHILRGVVKNDLMYPVIAIGETLRFFDKTTSGGFQLTLESDIPVGSGHGSSAAVAASVVAATAKFLGETTDKEIIRTIAIRVEQKRHGNPSYGDIGVVVNGGFIWFQKKSPDDIVIKPLNMTFPEKLAKNLLVIQSGMPAESTGEMVHYVREFREKEPAKFEAILKDQENLTRELLTALQNADEKFFLKILHDGGKNLETIGVVSPSAQELIRKIEKAGGVAKICGAGGKTEGSGILLVFSKKIRPIEMLAKANGLSYYTVLLGGEGLHVG